MENDDPNNALKNVGSAAIVLGPGAKENIFIGMDMSGYEKAVVTLTDGEKGPEGNQFIGGSFKRFQDAIPVAEQVIPASVTEAQQAPDPWYKQLGIQIAAGVFVAVAIALLVWIGVPLNG